MEHTTNRYNLLIQTIFNERYAPNASEVLFDRSDIVDTAERLGIELPKNLGDVIYTFRYRADLPASIADTAPEGYEWVISTGGTRTLPVRALKARFD